MKMFKTTVCFIITVMIGLKSIAQNETHKKLKHVEKHLQVKIEKDTLTKVGGSEMDPAKNIVENASKSNDHTTLISALNAAELVNKLTDAGPYTVFAPTNEAFELVGQVMIDSLLLPVHKDLLAKILTYHVVAGTHDSKNLLDLIAKNNGHGELKTLEGGILIAEKKGNRIMLTDENGTKAFITIRDVIQNNGIIHVIDRVLMPDTNVTTGKL